MLIFNVIQKCRNRSIATSYCGSLFVGHCSAEDMLEQILKFIRRLGLNTALFIHLGMECSSVNKSFVKKRIGCFEKDYQITFLTLRSWALHIVNSAFRKSITDLTMDIDQYACDLHFFFKYSSARREDLKHARSSWRCCMVCFKALFNKVVYYHKSNRVLELRKNLCEYFLKLLPKQKKFNFSL